MKAADALILSVHAARRMWQLSPSVATLANALAADCLTYRILGSTMINDSSLSGRAIYDEVDVLSVLQQAEAHSYHCCPPEILLIIVAASELSEHDESTRVATAAGLVEQAMGLDVRAWAYGIAGLAQFDDVEARVWLGSAHRAAACLYVLLAIPETAQVGTMPRADDLCLEIVGHLAMIPDDHVLLKGTAWPTFIAGAHTDEPETRKWCIERLTAVWRANEWVCHWGYVQTATQMLLDVWAAKETARRRGEDMTDRNWLQELKLRRGDFLIV